MLKSSVPLIRCSKIRLQLSSATYVRCPAVEATPNGVGMADGHLEGDIELVDITIHKALITDHIWK